MAEKKANRKIKLICLGVCLIILILWGKRFIPMSKKEKIFQNECCAATILRYIWDCEMTHHYKSKNFFDFGGITKIKLSKKITLNIKNGVVTKYGYHFKVYLLPGERKKKNFVCYAWPIKYDETGIHSYAIDESGYLFLCSNNVQKYSGDKKPDCAAAIPPKQKYIQSGSYGRDGEMWISGGSDVWHSLSQLQKEGRFTCD